MRVLITEPEAYSSKTKDCFPKTWTIVYADINNQDQLLAVCRADSFDIIFAKLGLTFDRNLFEIQPSLKLVATPTTGLNHISITDAEKFNIQILSLRGETEFLSKITSTAEHAWCLLLSLNRSLVTAVERVSAGSWKRQDMMVHELSGASLGIIGMGRLGKIVSRYGFAFQMKVASYDPYLDSTSFPVGCEKLSLEDLVATSDYVILLATYNEGDRPILSKSEFEKFRFGSVLINVARGELIDEEALLNALDNGTLRGFGADVLCGDSGWSSINSFNSKIVERSLLHSNIIITPHMGGYAVEAIEKTRQFMIYKVREYLNQIPVSD